MSDRRRRKATGLHSAQRCRKYPVSSVRMMPTRRARPSAGPARPCRPPRVPCSPANGSGSPGRTRPTKRTPASRAPIRSVIASPTITTSSRCERSLVQHPADDLGLRRRCAIDPGEPCRPPRAPRRSSAAPPQGCRTRRTTAARRARRASSAWAPRHERASEHLVEHQLREALAEPALVLVGVRPAQDLGRDVAELLIARNAHVLEVVGDGLRRCRQTAGERRSS